MNLMDFWKKARVMDAAGGAGVGGAPAPSTPPATPPAAATPPADAAPATPPAPDYSFVPAEFRNDSGVDAAGFQLYLDDLRATKSQVDERLAGVPEAADGYQFALPENFSYGEDLTLPDNFGLDFKTDDPDMAPIFSDLGSLLHQHGIPSAAAPQFMGLLARYEATRYSRSMQAHASEMEALGQNADARVSRVERALENKLPKEMAQALKGATGSALGVRALEQLLNPKTMNGAPAEPDPASQRNPLAERYPSMFKT